MNKEDIIKLTEKWLDKAPKIKENIKNIDMKLKKGNLAQSTIHRLQLERIQQGHKLTKIIDALGTLKKENQMIICYRYFDRLNYNQIALRVGLSESTIPRRIVKSLLDIGRVMFGFEDEFWKGIYFD